MIKNILYIFIGVFLWIVLVSLYGLYSSMHPRRYIHDDEPSNYNIRYEKVKIRTKDKLNLDAWFIPNKKSQKAIVMCHGYPFDKGTLLPFLTFLYDYFNILFFDFRSLGKSEGKYTSFGYHETKDLEAAVDFLKKKNIKIVGVMGFSLGASVALMSDNKDIKAIVADSPYANIDLMIKSMYRQFYFLKFPFVFFTKRFARWIYKIDADKISPLEAIKKTNTPVFLIHGDNDSQISVKNSYILHGFNKKTELWIIKNADHLEGHFVDEKEYEKKVLKFFNKHLK